jgi:hypothetical protein
MHLEAGVKRLCSEIINGEGLKRAKKSENPVQSFCFNPTLGERMAIAVYDPNVLYAGRL